MHFVQFTRIIEVYKKMKKKCFTYLFLHIKVHFLYIDKSFRGNLISSISANKCKAFVVLIFSVYCFQTKCRFSLNDFSEREEAALQEIFSCCGVSFNTFKKLSNTRAIAWWVIDSYLMFNFFNAYFLHF